MDKTVTPVKTFTRIHLTPSTKEFLRIVCGEKIENAQYRLKLLNKDVKTSYFEGKSAHTSDLWKVFFIKGLNQSIAMPVTEVLTQCDLNVKVKKFNQAPVNGGKRFGPRSGPTKSLGSFRILTFWRSVIIIEIIFSKKNILKKSADDKKAWKINYISSRS